MRRGASARPGGRSRQPEWKALRNGLPTGSRPHHIERASVASASDAWLWRSGMLKLLGSYALARLLGGGLVLAIVIYLLLSLFT